MHEGVALAPCRQGLSARAALREGATLIAYTLVAPIARGRGGRELRYSLPSFRWGEGGRSL